MPICCAIDVIDMLISKPDLIFKSHSQCSVHRADLLIGRGLTDLTHGPSSYVLPLSMYVHFHARITDHIPDARLSP